ncbi:MAG: NAD(P)H-dependent oxidoreductase [Propionibacterium sp.]|nr:NAD(P)H-dependent oxidoreductase [Propionibacterium sp.]
MTSQATRARTPERPTPEPYIGEPFLHSHQPVRVLLIIGSTRQGRFGPVPSAWAVEQARMRDDVELEVIDLAELSLPMVLPGDDYAAPLPESVTEFARRIEAADAVVVVTPVYNRGYPASLKNAIDWVYDEWAATPVGFISYGGRTGGIEAVEQLRAVFVELNTMTIRKVLTFPNFWEHFTDHGVATNPDAMARAATGFYDQLTWWARALRTARNRST